MPISNTHLSIFKIKLYFSSNIYLSEVRSRQCFDCRSIMKNDIWFVLDQRIEKVEDRSQIESSR